MCTFAPTSPLSPDVKDLHRKLMRYIRKYNTEARPIKWTYADTRNRFATIDSTGTVHLVVRKPRDGQKKDSAVPTRGYEQNNRR
jgi:hypothetical protein